MNYKESLSGSERLLSKYIIYLLPLVFCAVKSRKKMLHATELLSVISRPCVACTLFYNLYHTRGSIISTHAHTHTQTLSVLTQCVSRQQKCGDLFPVTDRK